MMERNANARLEAIVDAAFSGGEPAFSSAADRAKHLQHKKLAASLTSGFFDAPRESVDRAKAVFPTPDRRRLPWHVVGTTLGLVGARLESGEEAQVQIEAEGFRVRLMYGRSAEGWSLVGRVDRGEWVAHCSGDEVVCESDGRFSFTVPGLDQTAVLLTSRDAQIDIPRFEEVVKLGGQLDRPT